MTDYIVKGIKNKNEPLKNKKYTHTIQDKPLWTCYPEHIKELELIYLSCNDKGIFEIQNMIGDLLKKMIFSNSKKMIKAPKNTMTGRGKCRVCGKVITTKFLNLWCCEIPECIKTLHYWVNNTP